MHQCSATECCHWRVQGRAATEAGEERAGQALLLVKAHKTGRFLECSDGAVGYPYILCRTKGVSFHGC